MKLFIKSVNLKSAAFLSTFSFFLIFNISAQDGSSKPLDSVKKDNTIAISNISEESEKVAKYIQKLEKTLKPSTEIVEVDSIMNIVSLKFDEKKDSIFALLKTVSSREIRGLKIEWEGYKFSLNKYQDRIKERSEELSKISADIGDEIDKWESTKKSFEKNSTKTSYEGIDNIIESLQTVSSAAHERLEKVFNVQSGLTKLVLQVDEVIDEIELIEIEQTKNYFTFDSQPIWKKDTTSLAEVTNLDIQKDSTSKSTGIETTKNEISTFISANLKTFIFQIVFIVFLFLVIIKANKNWNKNLDELITPVEKQTKIILSHPISSALVSGVLISYFFYIGIIPGFGEIMLAVILLSTVYLFPKLTNKGFTTSLVFMFISFLIGTYTEYFVENSTQLRWVMIFDLLILGIALFLAKKITSTYPDQFGPVRKFFKIMAPIYIFLIIIGITGNIIGMVSLSKFIARGVLTSTLLGVVIFLVVKVITSLIIVFFNVRESSNIKAISTLIDVSNRRIQPALNWIGFFIWVKFTIQGFDLYDVLMMWLENIMQIEWLVGEVTISLGGILAFLSIIIVTILLAKLVATIFQDEWMIEILPRGASSAMSLILRILIVSIGFYLGLSAIGVDLSKLGFVIGALGVGIGFGLQNIVSNFISGLILAFERPINIGDAIEIDQEMGVVTNIGVRSSNIKTYTGAEAIIPNSDLISKKVVNWTLSNRDRRSKILMKTAPTADPNKVIELFNSIASNHKSTFKTPAPKTYFYGYDETGNLSFALMFWTTFSDTLKTNHAISLEIFEKLKEEGINAPAPVRRIINE